MNREDINAATINTDIQDVIQRAIVYMVSLAAVALGGLVLRRSPIGSTPAATTTIAPHTNVRAAILNATGSVVLVLGGMYKAFVKVMASASSAVSVTGEIYPRAYREVVIQHTARAVAWTASHVDGRLMVSSQPRATATISPTYLMLVMSPLAAHALGSLSITPTIFRVVRTPIASNSYGHVTIDFETRKQIPYDEDAPDIRSMLVDEDIRIVVVS